MKTYKYLLVLPFATAALASCGGTRFSATDYNNAVKIADNYATSIKNSKASSIEVGGHINSIKVKGDATWWSYKPQEENPLESSLISLIPNFDIKDGEINVDSQDIVTVSLPSSLVALATSAVEMDALSIISNLPKFPMNHNLVKVLYGIKKLKMTEDGIDWDNTAAESWKKAKVGFYSGNGRLKVTIDTDDIMSFIQEVQTAFGGGKVSNEEPVKKYPASFSLTTNSIGYIDSLGIKFSIEGAEGTWKNSDIYYAHIKGDVAVDLELKFAQKISAPITIKYQLTPYTVAPEGKPYDLTYRGTNLVRDAANVIGPTTSLSSLKKYVTFDWYSNYDRRSGILKEIYDDPIFNFNYWKDNEENIAFADESYEVLAIPKCTTTKTSFKQDYMILGADIYSYYQDDSFVTTSIDGRVISNASGFKSESTKILEAASDVIQQFCIKDDSGNKHLVEMDEIFINSNMLQDSGSEYIVNIAVAPYVPPYLGLK